MPTKFCSTQVLFLKSKYSCSSGIQLYLTISELASSHCIAGSTGFNDDSLTTLTYLTLLIFVATSSTESTSPVELVSTIDLAFCFA